MEIYTLNSRSFNAAEGFSSKIQVTSPNQHGSYTTENQAPTMSDAISIPQTPAMSDAMSTDGNMDVYSGSYINSSSNTHPISVMSDAISAIHDEYIATNNMHNLHKQEFTTDRIANGDLFDATTVLCTPAMKPTKVMNFHKGVQQKLLTSTPINEVVYNNVCFTPKISIHKVNNHIHQSKNRSVELSPISHNHTNYQQQEATDYFQPWVAESNVKSEWSAVCQSCTYDSIVSPLGHCKNAQSSSEYQPCFILSSSSSFDKKNDTKELYPTLSQLASPMVENAANSDYHLTPVSFRNRLIEDHLEMSAKKVTGDEDMHSKVQELSSMYKQCSEDIESQRYTEINKLQYQSLEQNANLATQDESIHEYFDQQHHSLQDRVETSLEVLNQSMNEDKPEEKEKEFSAKTQTSESTGNEENRQPFRNINLFPQNQPTVISTNNKLPFNSTDFDKALNISTVESIKAYISMIQQSGTENDHPQQPNNNNIIINTHTIETESTKQQEKPPKAMLSNDAVSVMNNWFKSHRSHPYPPNADVVTMAEQGRITPSQVRKWFANRRVRTGYTKDAGSTRGKRKDMGKDSVWMKNVIKVGIKKPMRL